MDAEGLFLVYFDQIYKGMKEGTILTPLSDRYKKSTLRNYRNLRAQLLSFEAETAPVQVKDISHKFMEGLRNYFMKKQLAKNTIGFYLSQVKSICKLLHKEGIISYSGAGFRIAMEQTTAVYSSVAELRDMYNFPGILPPGMEKVRDTYILHSFIGQRFEDFKTLVKNIKSCLIQEKGFWFFHIKTSKTGEVVVIPAAKLALEILEKWDYEVLGQFSLSYYNDTLKLIGQRLLESKTVIHSITKGGTRVDTLKEKYEMLSSHTARRNFATNAYLAGIPILNIMKITGHKNVNSFLRYIRCESLESALTIAGHPFFD